MNALRRYGIAFSGGGARGAFPAGMALALFEWAKYPPARVSGASVGTLNAAMYGQAYRDSGESIEQLERLWKTLRKYDIQSRIPRLFPGSISIYSHKKLDAIIRAKVDRHSLALSSVKFKAVAARFGPLPNVSATPDDPRFYDVMLASASFPIYFPPVRYGDDWLTDRGLSNNVPIYELIDDGCEVVFVLKCGKPRGEAFRGRRPTIHRVLGSLSSELMESQIVGQAAMVEKINADIESGVAPKGKRKIELHVIDAPAEPEIDTLEFDPKKATHAFAEGYKAMRRYIDQKEITL